MKLLGFVLEKAGVLIALEINAMRRDVGVVQGLAGAEAAGHVD